jgi:hypothetical protein
MKTGSGRLVIMQVAASLLVATYSGE